MKATLPAAALAVCCLGLAAPPSVAFDAPPALRATPVATGLQWDGPQYVGADGKGRVFLLRSEGLLVYPVASDGELGEPEALQTGALGSPDWVMDAAMDKHGDWLVLSGNAPRWFRSGEEEALPALHWLPTSVAFAGGRPVVATHPIPQGRVTSREIATPPCLLAASGDDWSVLADADLDKPYDLHQAERQEARTFARLLADSDGTLWLANLYRYRLLHYSAAGRELLSVEVNGGEMEHRESSDEVVVKAREELEKERARYPDAEKVRISVNTAVQQVFGLTEGPSGRIYLLVRGDGGPGTATLDRFDAVRGVLERTVLGADIRGSVSLAAGKDGLYMVPFNGHKQRYRVAWYDLENADWQPVDGVVINGLEMPARREG